MGAIQSNGQGAVGGELNLKEPKTKRSRRTITLGFSLDALRDHRKAMFAEGNYAADKPVFCGQRNRSWLRKSDVHRHSFAPALARAGLKFRFHDLRHACASWMIQAGIPLPVVQKHLGHESITITVDTYGHLDRASGRAAAEAIGRLLTDSSVSDVNN